jgi:fibronectin-binding autotransporter adhesin
MKKKFFIPSAIAAGFIASTLSQAVQAAEINWTGGEAGSFKQWSTLDNWQGGSLPGAADVAVFGPSAASPYGVNILSSAVTVSGLKFTGGNYSILLNQSLTVNSPQSASTTAGIINESLDTVTINLRPSGGISLSNGAINGKFDIVNAGGNINLINATLVGDVDITNTDASGSAFGKTTFDGNNASAGNAVITNNGFQPPNLNPPPTLNFDHSASAANAAITNNWGIVNFKNSASAGNATITNNSGAINFNNSASAANSVITNNANASLTFQSGSSLGNATFIENGGTFTIDSTVNFGAPKLVINSGVVNFSLASEGKVVTLGSLSGGSSSGSLLLGGGSTLSVGSDNTNSTFDGNIGIAGTTANNISTSGMIPGISFVKVGSGSLTLNNQYAFNSTTISAGTLNIGDATHTNAIISGPVTVGAQGILGGYGTINGNVDNAGTISPGGANANGTLTINGNYTQQSGSVYLANIDAQGNSDKLVINGVANLNNQGSLNLQVLNDFKINYQYTVLTATGGVNGKFANFTDSPFLDDRVIYADNSVSYVIDYKQDSIARASVTRNQRAVSSYLENVNQGTLNSVFQNKNDVDFQQQLDQMSGATYANQTMALANTGNWFDSQLDNHNTPITQLGHLPLWVASQISVNELASSDVSGLRTEQHGVAVGTDWDINATTTVGAALGMTHFEDSATDQENANATGDLYQLGAYIRHYTGSWRWDGEASYGMTNDVNSNRTIDSAANIGTVTSHGDYRASVYALRGTVGYDLFKAASAYQVEPFVGLIGQEVDRGSIHENASVNDFALDVNSSRYTSLRTQLGVNAGLMPWSETPAKLYGTLSWEHELADIRGEFDARFANVNNSQTFNIVGTEIGRDAAVVQAGINIPLTYQHQFTLDLSYQGRLAEHLRENLGLLQFNYKI